MKLEADEELSQMDALVEDNLSGSYVCSMSSNVDITLQDGLAANVQDYLSRIVDELHLISRWKADCCRYMLVCQEKQNREYNRRRASEHEKTLTEAATVANSPQNLLFQTDLELLRQEMQRSHLEIYQRCATNIAYVQSSFCTENDEQLNELQKRFDDKIRFFTQQTIGIIEKHHSEGDARMKNVEASIRQLQKQLSDGQKKLSSLKSSTTNSIATLSSSLYSQKGDTVSCIRRVENAETSLSLQFNDMRTSIDESLHSLKAGHSQLSSKIQVIRLELQENSDDCQRKLQLAKYLQNRSFDASHHQDTTTRVPILAHQTTGIKQFVPLGATSASNYSHQSNPRMKNEMLDFVSTNGISSSSYTGSGGGVKIPTGSAAMATPDCFLYAKVALPQREGASAAATLKRSAAYTTTGSGGNSSNDLEQPSSSPSQLRSPSTAEGKAEPTTIQELPHSLLTMF